MAESTAPLLSSDTELVWCLSSLIPESVWSFLFFWNLNEQLQSWMLIYSYMYACVGLQMAFPLNTSIHLHRILFSQVCTFIYIRLQWYCKLVAAKKIWAWTSFFLFGTFVFIYFPASLDSSLIQTPCQACMWLLIACSDFSVCLTNCV